MEQEVSSAAARERPACLEVGLRRRRLQDVRSQHGGAEVRGEEGDPRRNCERFEGQPEGSGERGYASRESRSNMDNESE